VRYHTNHSLHAQVHQQLSFINRSFESAGIYEVENFSVEEAKSLKRISDGVKDRLNRMSDTYIGSIHNRIHNIITATVELHDADTTKNYLNFLIN